MARPELVIITGMSGAGKSSAIRCFEEMGYFTVDNMPPGLLPMFVHLCAERAEPVEHLAAVIDIRGRGFFDDIQAALDQLDTAGDPYRIVYLDASTETLVSRFKEHRFPHPLSDECSNLLDCIETERQRLAELKGRASVILDTSDETVRQLRGEITRLFSPGGDQRTVQVVTFGFKYGLPSDVDYVFDVRFLRNPHHDLALRPLTGEDDRIRAYIEADPRAEELRERLFSLVDYVLPQHWEEGRHYVSFGISCTGGKHRSVLIAIDLARHCEAQGYHTVLTHRDFGRE